MKLTIEINDELFRLSENRAAGEGRTLAMLVEEGLRRLLEAPLSSRRAPTLPISSCTGGVHSGIDLNNSAALQDIFDKEERSQYFRQDETESE